MPITLLQSPAPAKPSAGKAAIFVDAADSVPKYVDENGVVHLMGSGANGATGQQGVPGNDGQDGQIRFTGNGPPGTIVGSRPDDVYLDRDTGILYILS